MQFYTFLETTLVTLSLLPYFLAFFSDGDITGTPGSLAAIFITFSKCIIENFVHQLRYFDISLIFFAFPVQF